MTETNKDQGEVQFHFTLYRRSVWKWLGSMFWALVHGQQQIILTPNLVTYDGEQIWPAPPPTQDGEQK